MEKLNIESTQVKKSFGDFYNELDVESKSKVDMEIKETFDSYVARL